MAEKKLDELYDLIGDIGVAMMTTRRTDGQLVSRPMATQDRSRKADLWFVTDRETHKLDEIEDDPHVNLAYYDDSSREWVSVSGTARLSTDRAQIRELWSPGWKPWFPDEGDERDGGPDDPRMVLILVEAESVTYMKQDQPRPVVLFELARSAITGERPDVGEVRQVRPDRE